MRLEMSSPSLHHQVAEVEQFRKSSPLREKQVDHSVTPKEKGEQQNWSRMRTPVKGQGNKIDASKRDITASLSDALLQRILLAVPEASRAPCSLVCHRWLLILGKTRRSLRLLDWGFLESGRLSLRFPELTDVDLTWACMRNATRSNSVVITKGNLDLYLPPLIVEPFSLESCIRKQQLRPEAMDRGLALLAKGCPELQRLRIVDVGHSPRGSLSEWEFVAGNQRVSDSKLTDITELHDSNLKQANMKNDGFKIISNLHKVEGLGPKAVAAAARARSRLVPLALESIEEGQENSKGVKAKGDGESEVGSVVLGPIEEDGFTPRSRRAKGFKGAKGKDADAEAEIGLISLAKGCPMLLDLEMHQCTDETMSSVAHFKNLQILRLVGTVEGFSRCSFTDVGLTILANNCRRLIKLELIGCEAGYAGIAAVGQCCLMLEELTLSTTGFEEGWLEALSHYGSLRTLKLEGCKRIDRQPGPAEFLKRCSTLERLQLMCCDLRDRVAFGALLSVCASVKELEIQDCWGLDDDTFALAGNCRKINLLSLDGCSLLTAAGLEVVVLASKELQRLRVVHCNNIRDSEVSLALGNIIITLKEFKWRPDTKSLLAGSPSLGQPGRWFFSKT